MRLNLNINRKKLTFSIILIFGVTILAGFLFNQLLLKLGLVEVVFRNALVLLTSYGVFFLTVKLWLKLVSANPNFIKDVAETRDYEMHKSAIKPEPVRNNNAGYWYDFLFNFIPDEVAVIVLVPLVFISVLLFFDAAGSWILADAIFDMALAGGLIRTLRKIERDEWENKLLKKTILIFLAFLFLTSVALFVMDQKCPNQSRISDMIQVCWSKK